MGFWPSGSWEAVKKNSPDLTPIKNAWWTTYNVGCNSVRTVKDATFNAGSVAVSTIRDNGTQMVKNYIPSPESIEKGTQMVKNYIPSPESIEKISPYVIHPASKELVKFFVPGATPVLGIAGALLKDKSSSLHSNLNDKKSELLEQLKMTKAENEILKAELERKKSEYPKITQTPAIIESTTIASQKPEEVISIFMMKGLNIRDLTANQVVPIRGTMTVNDRK